VIINKLLLTDLMKLGLWDERMKNAIIAANGSVANIPEIPADIKAIYKTVWEISQRKLVDMAAARGAYIDQSQSFNVFMTDANFGKLTSMHFYAWRKGLKTGMYYLRTKAAAQAIQFTVDQSTLKASAANPAQPAPAAAKNQADMVCSLTNKDECLSCGS
jgi:ribonucleoside-diphosphate reductase alpha chain